MRHDHLQDRVEPRQARAADAPESLVVEVRQGRDRPLVTVRGDLDLTGAGLLTAMLDHVRRTSTRAGGRPAVDVDLSGVTSADSRGVAVLDGRTRVVAASASVRRARRLLDGPPNGAVVHLRQDEPGAA